MENTLLNYNLIIEEGNYLCFEVFGEYSLVEGKRVLQEIFDKCVCNDACRLLVDITKKEGIIPDIDRFFLGEFIAKLFTYEIKFAVIGKKDQINKFSETVAYNRGTRLNIFSDKKEALKWLLNE